MASERERAGRVFDTAVIGAGQAGLSTAYFLRRAGLDFVVLDANPGPGGAWQHRWPSLRLGKVHGIHDLPGMALPHADDSRPASEVVGAYFGAYEREFDLPVVRPVRVTAVHDDGAVFTVEAEQGTWRARTLVSATGTWDRPFWPRYPGQETFRGTQLHTADYRGPEQFAGKRVVVVGGGASGVQALMELAPGAAATTWVTRRPPVWRDGPFTPELGREAVAMVEDAVREGRPPASVVSVTGLVRTPEVIAAQESGVLTRLPVFDRVTRDGVAWDDGRFVAADTILWATGFRHSLDHLAPLHLRAPGGGITMDGTQVAGHPRLHLVGYGPSASTIGATRAGRAAAAALKRLAASTALPTG
ncbi:FAD-dependent oxidoreductase [Actinokineospora bangkokensis]|uniref:Pyridine nucleotide-disulfide oxidoreductase n=1 Tax=Actinokineospora bangkokensis TaxID=1193682 RepID=A0A1Q9LU06_9PSEU|nr:FAD-dependent oxidoreductase [Actinokineospora bangkokensis]OLR95516.1 pyridine nucleotide-disulfide oxidoreductase [Actinokineospora bangkokensis]